MHISHRIGIGAQTQKCLHQFRVACVTRCTNQGNRFESIGGRPLEYFIHRPKLEHFGIQIKFFVIALRMSDPPHSQK